jgi:hypothetical protein
VPDKKDIILILILLAVGLALLALRQWRFAPGDNGQLYAEITHGDIIYSIPLHDDKVFSLPSAPHVVFEVRGGRIAFVQSDCPDRICIHAGFQGRPGQMAACLPNRLVVHITNRNANPNDIDIFTR